MHKLISLSFIMTVAVNSLADVPNPVPTPPVGQWTVAAHTQAPNGPVVYEHSGEAGPDQTFFLVGTRLSTNVIAWGNAAENSGGREWKAHVLFVTSNYLAATLPERAPDGPFLVWLQDANGTSAPFVLNAPQPWWCSPDNAAPGEQVRVFGRNLARRPDFSRAFVYLCQKGKAGVWADILKPGKYATAFRVPENLVEGDYEVWMHAGSGGNYGWGGPLALHVQAAGKKSISSTSKQGHVTELKPDVKGDQLQSALDELAIGEGGTLRLLAGNYEFSGTLKIPAHVTLAGTGRDRTTLQLVYDPTAHFARLSGSGWNQGPSAVHSVGDIMEYSLHIPQGGEWNLWLRYATDMKPYNQPGVSGNHAVSIDDGAFVPLMNLENTGGWGTFRWTNAATLTLTSGRHKMTWKNLKGGGIQIDAFLFARNANYVPPTTPFPTNSPQMLVIQGEDCSRFISKEGQMPGGERAAVWLAGDGAGLTDLTVLGNAQVNYGIALRSPESRKWLQQCQVSNVRVVDCDGKQGENCGLHVRYAERASVHNSELWGRAPLFISGARKCEFTGNRLVSVTRFGGNAEAAILGRNETIEQCIVENNVIASPAGAEAGGPTARRLLWFSTGHGSITHNYIAGNGVEKPNGPGADVGAGMARFGGVAGTDQNVGEMILFEGNHRTAFFGALAGAGQQTVTLPKVLEPTPDNRLGSVKRTQLAHDAAGNETPFWPPDVDDGSDEPPIYEYYVTIMSGLGQGQTRRVLRRVNETLWLERPWSVPPQAGSVVAIGTAFYRNLIVDNYTPDGMTGIQLWISCIENVVAANSIARQRKPGLYLYANGTTLASSMPRQWNRGISPLFWNVCEGNRIEECSAGALVTSGDERSLPIEFPRALGNVLRHNSFIRCRTDGVIMASRGPVSGVRDTASSVTGTIVEFNVVRDAQVGYHAGNNSDAVVFRRNHAYFWYPVSLSTNPPVAIQVDKEDTTVAVELNSIEGIHGTHDGPIRDYKTPGGVRRLPE